MNANGKSKHLSSAELEAMLETAAGAEHAAPAYVAAHLGDCAECAAELEGLRGALAAFKGAAVLGAERQHAMMRNAGAAAGLQRAAGLRDVAAGKAGVERGRMGMGWALAGVAGCLAAVAVPLAHHGGGRDAETVQPVTKSTAAGAGPAAMSDDALLSSIQSDLSASVPAPLLPLANGERSSSTQNR